MKSKVKELKDLKKQDDFGNHKFIITLENGDSGFFASKTNPPAAKVGEELEYEITPFQGKDGKEYKKISLPKKSFKGGFDPKTQLITTAAQVAATLVGGLATGAGGLQPDSLASAFEKLFDRVYTKIKQQ